MAFRAFQALAVVAVLSGGVLGLTAGEANDRSGGTNQPRRITVVRDPATPVVSSARALRSLAAKTRGEAGAPRELRRFPHDLHGRGAPGRRLPRSLAERIQEAAARSATGPPAPTVVRVAILKIDFSEDRIAPDETTGDGKFDLRTGTGIPVDPPPHNNAYIGSHAEALRRYYETQSYESLQLVATVFPSDPEGAYSLSDMGEYGPWEVSQDEEIIEMAERFTTDAINVVDASGDVVFSDFDAYVVLHAGADFQGDINRDTPYDIPSFTLTFGESLMTSTGDIGRVLVLPESPSQDGRLAALNGVFAHEFGHVLGLPDLYNIFNGIPQVGYFSLMDSGENIPAIVVDAETGEEFEAEGIFPTSFDPWSKLELFGDVMIPRFVEEAFDDTLEAIEVDPTLVVAIADLSGLGSADEFFLVENRALDLDGSGFPFVFQDSTGVFLGPVDAPDSLGFGEGGRYEYDAVLPGGGVIIWHLDEFRVSQGLFFYGAFNFDTLNRGLAVEEADGIWDQGRFSFGRPEDLWYQGNYTLFGPETVPDTETNDRSHTGVTIEVHDPPGRFMRVTAERRYGREGWPQRFRQDDVVRVTTGSVTPAEFTGDGRPEVITDLEIRTGSTDRGLLALEPEGSVYVPEGVDFPDPRMYGYRQRLNGSLVSSSSFVLRPGERPVNVVAGLTGSVPFLTDANGDTLFETSVLPPPSTGGVMIWHRGDEPDLVVAPGLGALNAFSVPGSIALVDSAREATFHNARTAPVFVPDVPLSVGFPNPVVENVSLFAVGYEEGILEFFAFVTDATKPGPLRFATEIDHLVSGRVKPGPSEVADLVVVTEDSVAVVSLPLGQVETAWPLPEAPARHAVLGDLDADGRLEVVLATENWILAYNGDGSPALGWPRELNGPVQDLKLLDLDGNGSLDLLALDGRGRFQGFDGGGHLLDTYPRPLGPVTLTSSYLADMDGDGSMTWVGSTEEAALLAVRFPEARAILGDWRYAGGSPGGGGYQSIPDLSEPLPGQPQLREPLFVYPNPARGSGVQIRFVLDSGESAELSVLNLAGQKLNDARFQPGSGFTTGENAVRWDIDNVAPGLYFCRLQREGPSGRQVELARVVIVR